MVSKKTIFSILSLTVIAILVLSFIIPPLLLPPIPRDEPYEDVPPFGAGVVVNTTGDDALLINITIDDVPFDLPWDINPFETFALVSPNDPPRYWKRTAYDTYSYISGSGSSWGKDNSTRVPLAERASAGDTVYTVSMNITHGLGGDLELYSLWPNPWIIPDSVTSPYLQLPYTLETDQYGSTILNGRFDSNGTSELTYQVTYDSTLNWTEIRPQAVSASNTPSSFSLYQTQGLDQLSTPTSNDIQNRLDAILAGVPDNAFEEAFAILEYFKETFTFDLSAERPGSSECVEWFLSGGTGIGQDFATAYTMFLRKQGIAARPVFGAALGVLDGSQRSLQFMHLHFWVEVYIPISSSEGYWLQFDPTPLPGFITGTPPARDPYVVSTYYDLAIDVPTPIVDRGVQFQVQATLTKDGLPAPGETVEFWDDTENWLLGTNTTSATGDASVTFTYNNSAIVGVHILRAYSHGKNDYGGIGLHGAANLTFFASPLELNRTSQILFNGTLTDAVNGRGVSQYETMLTEVDIYINAQIAASEFTDQDGIYTTFYSIPQDHHPLGVATAFASFSVPGVIDPVVSLPQVLNITARSKLSIQAVPNAARANSNVSISGQLLFENDTAIPGVTVQIFWNGTPLGGVITDGSGNFLYEHNATSLGQVTVEAQYLGGANVFGSRGTVPVVIHDDGTIVVFVDDDDGDDLTQRGNWVQFTGWVENSTGQPQGGVTVNLFFNGSFIVTTTTNASGGIDYWYQVPTSQPVGLLEVTGDVVSSTLQVVSTLDYLSINSTTQLISLQFNASQARVEEGIVFTGHLVDDQLGQISGANISAELSYDTTVISLGWTLTQANGVFQFISTLPASIPATVSSVNFSASFNGDVFYGTSNASQTLDVFVNVTLIIDVDNGPHPGRTSISVNGTLRDSFGRSLSNREILLIFSGEVVFSGSTNNQGRVSFTLQLPSGLPQVSSYPVQLQHNTVILIESNQELILVEAEIIMQFPIPIGYIILLAILIIGAIIAVIIYRRLRGRGPRGSRGGPSVDAASMLTELRQLLSDQKYRESILYAFRMFETIVQGKLGIFRDPNMTLREFANLTTAQGGLDTTSMQVFIRGVEEAKFSDHQISYQTCLTTLNAFANNYNVLTGGSLRFVTSQETPQ